MFTDVNEDEVQQNLPSLKTNVFYDSKHEFFENCEKTQSEHAKKFKVLQLNAQSIRSTTKFDEFKMFLKSGAFDYHVVAICESWILSGQKDLYQIDGYSAIFSCRDERPRGSMVIYVKNGLNYTTSQITSSNTHVVSIILKAICNRTNTNLRISLIYRPPDEKYEDFENVFEPVLASGNMNHLILGDFNYDLRRTSSETKKYIQLLSAYGFSITNNNITRDESQSILDHVVSNFSRHCHHNNWTFSVDEMSDHNAVLTMLDFEAALESNIRETKKINFCNLNRDLQQIFSNISEFNDPNALYEFVLESLNTAIIKNTTVSMKKMRKKDNCPWMTSELKKIINEKDNFWRKNKSKKN